MDRVARLDAAVRQELFRDTGYATKLLPAVVEKDFWVCWALKHVFAVPEFESHILFKGGTSLSKIFGVIERFSEDVDLALACDVLGFDGAAELLSPDMSSTKRDKMLKQMDAASRAYIASDFRELLESRFVDVLDQSDDWQLAVAPDNPDILNFSYPRTATGHDYVRPEIHLEIGARAEFIPNERYSIRPYAADHFPDVFEDANCSVQAIKAERTFWEKVTILHQEHFRLKHFGPPERYSRHYYDTYMMARHDEMRQIVLSSVALLPRVVTHKRFFYPRKWARYDLAVPETIELLPADCWFDYLREDYDKMLIMMFGESPSFEQIMDGLASLQAQIRRMKP